MDDNLRRLVRDGMICLMYFRPTDKSIYFSFFCFFALFLPFDLPISFDFHCTVVWWIYRSLHLRQSHTAWTNSTKLFYTSIIILTHQIKSSKNEGVKLGIVFVFLLFKICTECMPKFATLISPSHGSHAVLKKKNLKHLILAPAQINVLLL